MLAPLVRQQEQLASARREPLVGLAVGQPEPVEQGEPVAVEEVVVGAKVLEPEAARAPGQLALAVKVAAEVVGAHLA
jgi:hypothetical protein